MKKSIFKAFSAIIMLICAALCVFTAADTGSVREFSVVSAASKNKNKTEKKITSDVYYVTVTEGKTASAVINTNGAYVKIKSSDTRVAFGSKGKVKDGKFTLTIEGRSKGSAVITVYDEKNADNAAKINVTVKEAETAKKYSFRTEKLYTSHYEKHGAEFGDITKEEYLEGANRLISSKSKSVLSKKSKDGDTVFFDKDTGEFAVLSRDGYIRTYFIPDDGKDYYDRQ